ncbi:MULTISPECIES: dipeptide ABC transporter ATP-binding protein [Halococcus]|uniref:Oligopeptide/dipeptide ABC transporter, ATPase subunit n=1 Tax=Halococcus salifodinae DSM 8989 TaxID=1227456 RepID=M0NCI1_9EURY|nr:MULTISPECIES: ABC transporter ATP-binding protein [Halococcus]EMA55526.1 oligopeptide/dipeptide ABC transporter, ATPase subunit [Halococcus salifodinae DSM 8989]
MSDPLLRVEELHTRFDTDRGPVHAVDGASFSVDRGEIVGLLGESGSGKSVTARSICRLESPARIVDGTITFDGTELTTADESTLRRIRGNELSMVFQDPTETLNPVFPIGEQISEAVRIHETNGQQRLADFLGVPLLRDRSAWAEARERAVELLAAMDVPNPESGSAAFPHEFSGGMRQRAVLATALASEPELLIADEPTTALDTTTQADILRRLRTLRDERDIGVLLISHDIGVIAQTCDRVVVLYGGQVMEAGPVEEVLTAPEHPYTRTLLACSVRSNDPGERARSIDGNPPNPIGGHEKCPFVDRCRHATPACHDGPVPTIERNPDHRLACVEAPLPPNHADTPGQKRSTPDSVNGTTQRERTASESRSRTPVIEAKNVSKEFSGERSFLDRLRTDEPSAEAVRDASLSVDTGETVGLVGESGCGKSTLAKLLTGQLTPSQGQVRLDGTRVGEIGDRSYSQRRQIGVVFQHVRESFDPRWPIGRSLSEALDDPGTVSTAEADLDDVDGLLESVDLSPQIADRYPRELSGGQLQRVALARALAHDPDVIVLDEPVSGLDVATQATILDLLGDVQRRFGVGYVFISHDLDVVRYLADRVAVMYAGEIVERGPAKELFEQPSHPYTDALLRAIPSDVPGDDRPTPLRGDPPDPTDRPTGCSFHPRCPAATTECAERQPDFETIDSSRVRCFHAPDATGESNDDGSSPERTGSR